MKQKYAWSRCGDDEIWHGGPCDTIKECVDEALAEGYSMEDSFALGITEKYEIGSLFADRIIEDLQQDAYDEVGEIAYDWLESVTALQKEELETLIQHVVYMWLSRINEKPTFYKVHPCEECTLKEAMEIHNEKVANMSRGGKIDD